MISAIAYNAHYLFESGVLNFNRPVEIHVSRFANNQNIVDMLVPTYPKYNIPFTNPDAFKVYINCNEPITSPNRERVDVVIANHSQYDLILTTDEEILRSFFLSFHCLARSYTRVMLSSTDTYSFTHCLNAFSSCGRGLLIPASSDITLIYNLCIENNSSERTYRDLNLFTKSGK